jgi:membrane-associated phospholipid phosphatase
VIKTRRFWFWAIVALVAAISLAIAFWLDPLVNRWIVERPNRQLRTVMHQVSRYGDWPTHVVLGLALLLIAWWQKSRKWSRVFLAMMIACALAGAAARVIKITTGRARPSVRTELTWAGPSLSSKYHAFPSGHTASSTAFFAVLLFVCWRIGLACLVIPALIAFSRMYVAAHYLSDVVFAALLGMLCAWIVVRLMKVTNSPDLHRRMGRTSSPAKP